MAKNACPFKVYRADEYVGCTRYAEDAAALVSTGSENATVRYNHKKVIWREGKETISAGESYDEAAEIMRNRVAEWESGALQRHINRLVKKFDQVKNERLATS